MSGLIKSLNIHGIEVWEGFAVEVYTVDGVIGEAFTPLTALLDSEALIVWLGY